MKRALCGLLCLIFPLMGSAKESIVDTVHNLSTSGPGQYRSDSVDQICAFCHTPHRAATGQGLWNRTDPRIPEEMYSSSTSVVQTADLSGSSLLCQSCHDGTIALGEMRNPPAQARGKNRNLRGVVLRGRSRIGSNLANHHPVGFNYDEVYRSAGDDLKQSHELDLPLEQGEMQCTTCHDAHSSNDPPFLRKPSNWGELCLSCHKLSGQEWAWSESSHASASNVPRGNNPWPERKPEWAGQNVADNACQSCHAPHHANPGERLMVDKEESLCFRCHDGSVASTDIRRELQKFSRHPVEMDSRGRHDAVREELGGGLQMHAECSDCHNPHASKPAPPMVTVFQNNSVVRSGTEAPYANDVIAGVPGIDIRGQYVEEIEYQYELCFRCHGEQGRSACGNGRCSTAEKHQLARQDNLYNLREKVDPASPQLVSWHPLVENNQANNDEVPSLNTVPELNATTSLIYCTDCHNNDSAEIAGGVGPNGPHGSRYEGLLVAGYQLDPNGRFNVSSDRLCFTCHDPNSLFSDISFPHRRHVQQEGEICASCHDPHGSAVYPHLINFLISTNTGRDLNIVGAGGYTEPTWFDDGKFKGTCYLSCHGVVHDGSDY